MKKTRHNTTSTTTDVSSSSVRTKADRAKVMKTLQPTTPKEVAEWMIAQVERKEQLLQVKAVAAIEKKFGSEFVYVSDIGELSIDRRVLYHFQKLSGDEIVWVTQHGGGLWPKAHWRKRGLGDSPDRTQYEF